MANNNNIAIPSQQVIDTVIKIIAIVLLGTWCFDIIRPFILPMAWGAIIATALFPLFNKMVSLFGNRIKAAATVFAIVGISILVIPTIIFGGSAIESISAVSEQLKEGALVIPHPDVSVKDWPFIGEKTYIAWETAATNLEAFTDQYSEQIKNTISTLLGAVASFGGIIFQFIFSMLIAAMFLANSESCIKGCHSFFKRLMGNRSDTVLKNTVATVRSVGAGILGIAFTQAMLAGVGLVLADIPAAGLWVLLVLLVAIVQLPPILILGPIAAYYFSIADTTPAVIFLVWSLLVSASDAVLKPILLGRGTDIPMLVILIGAIGGMIFSGIIGLFTGAVILSLGYQLMLMWLEQGSTEDEQSIEPTTKF
ncbi:AI-2E family transporter [Thalassomonas sp. M1454]|uniref:AI-2E family transporter n=1 Tax=Thalassomonas sp. M1454 TaxID=2594477 RepID=UPI0011816F38|nr:AI-2E family transporter [Thalassomonas sp. M1454]TRX52691.1 AI-2E family transporter [Thalassomonas sp. M1454]